MMFNSFHLICQTKLQSKFILITLLFFVVMMCVIFSYRGRWYKLESRVWKEEKDKWFSDALIFVYINWNKCGTNIEKKTIVERRQMNNFKGRLKSTSLNGSKVKKSESFRTRLQKKLTNHRWHNIDLENFK